MAAGGARPGAGRPKGASQKVSTIARKQAAAEGLLPHEWLLKISRGEPVKQRVQVGVVERGAKKGEPVYREVDVYPDFNTRIDAAKSAAPFYAPRYTTTAVKTAGGSGDSLAEVLRELAEQLPG